MAWQSPYRGEESTPGRLAKIGPWVSRGVMLLAGVAIAVAGVRGIFYLADMYAAQPTPWVQTSSSWNGRPRTDSMRLLASLACTGAALIGVTLAIAAVLPVGSVQSFVERFMRPPVTGDRTGDDQYGITEFVRFVHRWWWWR